MFGTVISIGARVTGGRADVDAGPDVGGDVATVDVDGDVAAVAAAATVVGAAASGASLPQDTAPTVHAATRQTMVTARRRDISENLVTLSNRETAEATRSGYLGT